MQMLQNSTCLSRSQLMHHVKCRGVCSLIPIEFQFPQCSLLTTPHGRSHSPPLPAPMATKIPERLGQHGTRHYVNNKWASLASWLFNYGEIEKKRSPQSLHGPIFGLFVEQAAAKQGFNAKWTLWPLLAIF